MSDRPPPEGPSTPGWGPPDQPAGTGASPPGQPAGSEPIWLPGATRPTWGPSDAGVESPAPTWSPTTQTPHERYRPLGTLSAWVEGLLVGALLLEILTIVDAALIATNAGALGGEGGRVSGTLLKLDLVMTFASLLWLIPTGIVFIVWFHAAYRGLPALEFSGRRHTPKWAILGWFVPFLNLVRPYRIADDLWRAGGEYEAGVRRRAGNSSSLVSTWWTFYLLSNIGEGALGRMTTTTSDQFLLYAAGRAVVSVFAIIGLACAVVMVRAITVGLRQRVVGLARAGRIHPEMSEPART